MEQRVLTITAQRRLTKDVWEMRLAGDAAGCDVPGGL